MVKKKSSKAVAPKKGSSLGAKFLEKKKQKEQAAKTPKKGGMFDGLFKHKAKPEKKIEKPRKDVKPVQKHAKKEGMFGHLFEHKPKPAEKKVEPVKKTEAAPQKNKGSMFGHLFDHKHKKLEQVKPLEKPKDLNKPQKSEETEKKQNLFAKLFHKEPKKKLSHEFLEKKLEKVKKQKPKPQRRKFRIRLHLDTAGIKTDPALISKRIFYITIALTFILSAYIMFFYATIEGFTIPKVLLGFGFIWTVVFTGILCLLWIIFYVYIDVKIFQRKSAIEAVLPDYLQLTASNIKAGMTVDRALWYAVRPRFGVLADEIENVAKETMKGIDLKIALQKFANKYDSTILKRAISLLVEGIESGGEIGALLNKISINIQENRIMQREMAANVTTYVIFISFATVAAAPVLFALSGVLIQVISSLGSSLGSATEAGGGFGFAITFSGSGIKYGDFQIFAVTSLIVTSFFSSIIIATILKGNAKAGMKYIPMFIAATVIIFLAADFFLSKFVGFIV